MRMRLSLITLLMVSTLTAFESRHFCVSALERSAHSFSQYFYALRREPLNPIERVFFSLVLTRTKAQQECRVGRHGA